METDSEDSLPASDSGGISSACVSIRCCVSNTGYLIPSETGKSVRYYFHGSDAPFHPSCANDRRDVKHTFVECFVELSFCFRTRKRKLI
ncbi:hypothetical protein TNCT_207671 [Trichonephila clavata]|uniref:Uncharacterized protein n=1 Tax=Trichonephila clavata TaxID=2740835 RepID=A0A8X6HGN1_TRICU|nr:hypothetical protein TNCT_207671 [Trichonephila clavata]